ncbi:MAG: hypothetical protein WD076_00255 [Parvularculaceae bacterium]
MRGPLWACAAVAAMSLGTAFAVPALAQDVNGAPNPDVNAGDASVSLRLAYIPASGGAPYGFAEQLAFQKSLSGKWSVRASVQHGTRGGGDFSFRAAQVDGLYQFAEDQDVGWDGSILVAVRMPDEGDGPGRAGGAFAAKVMLDDRWEVRGVVFAGGEFGLNARNGMTLGTRLEATRDIGALVRVGALLVDGYNTTAHFGGFNEQSHQLGVVLKGFLSRAISYNAGATFGISEAAAASEFRLFLFYAL